MDEVSEHLMNVAEDGFWSQIQTEARRVAESEPMLVSFLFASVLRHSQLEQALGVILANKLQSPEFPAMLLRDLITEGLTMQLSIHASIRADLLAARTRDPAAHGYMEPFLYYKGFHALQSYRVAHWLWEQGRPSLGCAHPEPNPSEAFGVDVHPAAPDWLGDLDRPRNKRRHRRDSRDRGQRLTASRSYLGRNGARRREIGTRKSGGVLIGITPKILGNIEVGTGAKVGIGSVAC